MVNKSATNSQVSKDDRRILLAVTGASGAVYADRLLVSLSQSVDRVYLVVTETAEKVIDHELSSEKSSLLRRALAKNLTEDERKIIRVFSNSDLFSPVASGSSAATDMVVVPASMGSVSRMAQGVSSNLLERAADVMMKHRRRIIVCPRETPFNLIHLRNLTTLCEAGAQILPLMPAFYHKPQNLEDMVGFCVGRILEQLDLSHDLYPAWNARMR